MTRQSDQCRRLEDAICDGRFAEDPSLWASHVESCLPCRQKVEGVFLVEELFNRVAEEAPVFERDPDRSRRAIDAVFRRYAERRRNIRTTGVCVGVGLAAILIIGFLAPHSDPPADPVAYARQLHERVFPKEGPPRYDLLKSDETVRRKYLAALEDRSSLVRRTALWALLSSGIEIPAKRLEAILAGWKEDLEAPITVAATGAAGDRQFQEALDSRRDETLKRVLTGSQILRSQGKAGVSAALITPFLVHPTTDVRRRAILALRSDPIYRPGDEMLRLLALDPSADARADAARVLIEKLGAEGAARVLAHLRSKADPDVEVAAVPLLVSFPEGLGFSRQRIVDSTVPPRPLIAHAIALLRLGESVSSEDLVERVLATQDPLNWLALVDFCREARYGECRLALQQRWRELAPSDARTQLAIGLVSWDIAARSESALHLALQIFEADHDERLVFWLRQLASWEEEEAARKARSLLESRGKR